MWWRLTLVVCLLCLGFAGCGGGGSSDAGVILSGQTTEGDSYAPPTPIFRDIRIFVSSSHLSSDDSGIEKLLATLEDVTVEGDDTLSLLSDDLQVDLSTEDSVLIATAEVFDSTVYNQVEVDFAGVEIEGSVTSGGSTFPYRLLTSQSVSSAIALPKEIFSSHADDSSEQATLIFGAVSLSSIDINFKLSSFATTTASVGSYVAQTNPTPGEVIEISDTSTEPFKQAALQNLVKDLKNDASAEITENIEEEKKSSLGGDKGVTERKTRKWGLIGEEWASEQWKPGQESEEEDSEAATKSADEADKAAKKAIQDAAKVAEQSDNDDDVEDAKVASEDAKKAAEVAKKASEDAAEAVKKAKKAEEDLEKANDEAAKKKAKADIEAAKNAADEAAARAKKAADDAKEAAKKVAEKVKKSGKK